LGTGRKQVEDPLAIKAPSSRRTFKIEYIEHDEEYYFSKNVKKIPECTMY
jgi:hypothetical protein